MGPWWLYLLIFAFGYFTCRIFYFLRSARLSLLMVRASHIIYLSSMIKALEHLLHSREIMLEHLLKSEKNSTYISSFEVRFNEDVNLLKKRSVQTLINCHPKFFRHMIEFNDWDGAMQYLEENKKVALQFWNKQ
jgi:hypothetical protein